MICIAMFSAAPVTARKPARHHTKKHHSASHRKSSTIIRETTAKKSELARIKHEIAKVQAELKEHERLERASRKNLGAFTRRTHELEHIIASLEAEAASIEAERVEVGESITKAESDLDSLKGAYARSVRNFYVNNLRASNAVASEASDIDRNEQVARVAHYAHTIGDAHSMNKDRLDALKTSLASNEASLSETLDEQQAQIEARASEQTEIAQQQEAEQQKLAKIQADKAKLERELRERKASEAKLESIIAGLVSKETSAAKKRKKTPTSRRNESENVAPEAAELPGTNHPHSLKWPTASHHIKEGFGEHRNKELNTVTMNLGIDLAASTGSAVTAAADGIVSVVSSLPGYGTIIVLRHAGGLHTVYADLSGAAVSRGARVKAGQQIARSGTNEELGPSLHFEVWKGKSKQNPLGWLR